VLPIEHLEKCKHREICFVPLAWTFFDEIVTRIKRVRDYPGDKFIRYFPDIQIL
jgi:hypothetical protein